MRVETERPEPAAPAAPSIVDEVARGLEAMRVREVERRRGRLHGLNEEQHALIDQLTRDLLHRAVLQGLRDVARRRCGMTQGEMRGIREMFPTAA